jgi:ligand-binding sensor domain-containing protein
MRMLKINGVHLTFSLTILFFFISLNCLAQPAQTWENYTNGQYVFCAVADSNFVWLGTSGGLVKINKTTLEKVIYNRANSGLPNNYVGSIALDSCGVLWLGCQGDSFYNRGGLCTFDGTNWTNYNTANSELPNDSVTGILIDSLGVKWVGTGAGIVKIYGDTWTIHNEQNVFSGAYFIADGPGNTLWMCCNGALLKVENEDFANYQYYPSPLPIDHFTSLAFDRTGVVWVTGRGGLVSFDGTTWMLYNQTNSGLPGNNTKFVVIDTDDNKWVGTSYGGLARFDGVNWTVYNMANSGLPSNNIRSLLLEDPFKLWVCTLDGLAEFNGTNWQSTATSNSGLPANEISCVAIAPDGTKWFGTDYNGVVRYNGSDWTVFNSGNTIIPNDQIFSLAIAQDGTIWVGTGMGLAKYSELDWTVFDTSNSGLPNNDITSLVIDANNHLWIGTEMGLTRYTGTTWTTYTPTSLPYPYNYILCLGIDNAEHIWAGTANSGLARFNGTVWTVFNTTNSDIPSDRINYLAIDDSNQVWIGTNNGLACLCYGEFFCFNRSNSVLQSNLIESVAVDASGNVWVGSRSAVSYINETPIVQDGSLAVFNGLDFTIFNASNSGIGTNYVSSIAFDGNGALWMGTKSGGVSSLDIDVVHYLNPPTDISIGKDNVDVSLHWSPSLTANHYNVYSAESPEGTFTQDNSGFFDGVNWYCLPTEAKKFFKISAARQ